MRQPHYAKPLSHQDALRSLSLRKCQTNTGSGRRRGHSLVSGLLELVMHMTDRWNSLQHKLFMTKCFHASVVRLEGCMGLEVLLK